MTIAQHHAGRWSISLRYVRVHMCFHLHNLTVPKTLHFTLIPCMATHRQPAMCQFIAQVWIFVKREKQCLFHRRISEAVRLGSLENILVEEVVLLFPVKIYGYHVCHLHRSLIERGNLSQ